MASRGRIFLFSPLPPLYFAILPLFFLGDLCEYQLNYSPCGKLQESQLLVSTLPETLTPLSKERLGERFFPPLPPYFSLPWTTDPDGPVRLTGVVFPHYTEVP